MKCWKGIELEGVEKGVTTLFVKDSIIDCDIVVDLLQRNTDCQRVYLGAGRIDVTKIDNFVRLNSYCSKNNIFIIVECSVDGLKKLPEVLVEDSYQIIARIDNQFFDKLSASDVIKIDSEKHVRTIEIDEMIHTDLKNLNKDMFSTDILLYANEDGGEA